MDHLLQGVVTTSRRRNITTVLLRIHCDPDETLALYALSPDSSHRLAYRPLPTERHADHMMARFNVQDNQVFLFVVAGQSNESAIPFEVTYAVFNGEVIYLPGNDVVELAGTTHLFPDGTQNVQR